MLGSSRRRPSPARRLAAAMLAVPLAMTGCSGSDEGEPAPEAAEPVRVQARHAAPPDGPTVVPAEGALELAVAASTALFDEAPVVVVAAEDDTTAQGRAASAAVALGVPLLLSPVSPGDGAAEEGSSTSSPDAGPDAAVADEIDRLTTRAVLAFGAAAATWADEHAGDVAVVAAPDDTAALAGFGELDLGDPEAVSPGGLTTAIASLATERPPLLTVEPTDDAPYPADPADPAETGDGDEGGGGHEDGDEDELPGVDAGEPLEDLLVVVDRAGTGAAAAATARASGARVVPVTGADPRADAEAIAALATAPLPDRVVAFGEGFGPADRLGQRLEVAATGVELPGGGQVLYPHRRMIALYGHPGAPVLGVLGEQPVDAAVTRAQEMAAGYDGLVDEPVVPAFEIITTVASSSPGPDGDYSSEMEVADLRPWVDAAAEAGVYVVLDLQPGRTDFLTQAQRYEEVLAEPHVGLALDPEWRLAPDQRHMAQIGSVGVDEVNAVAGWMAELTRHHQLPQKLLLLHQFQLRMISDRGRVDTSHDELAVLVHADGFGTPGQKFDTWNALRSQPLADAWWGWKNFIDEDQPTFTPAQTVAVDPTPWFVSYQ